MGLLKKVLSATARARALILFGIGALGLLSGADGLRAATVEDFHVTDVFVSDQPDQGAFIFAYVSDDQGMFGRRVFFVNGDPRKQPSLELAEVRTSYRGLGEYPIPLRSPSDELDLEEAGRRLQSSLRTMPEIELRSFYESARLRAGPDGLTLHNKTADVVARYARPSADSGGWAAFKNLFGASDAFGSLALGSGQSFFTAFDWNRATYENKPHFKISRQLALKLQTDFQQLASKSDFIALDPNDSGLRDGLKAATGLSFTLFRLTGPRTSSQAATNWKSETRTPELLAVDRDGEPVWLKADTEQDRHKVEYWVFRSRGDDVLSVRKDSFFDLSFSSAKWFPLVTFNSGPVHRMLTDSPSASNYTLYSKLKPANRKGASYAIGSSLQPFLAHLIPGDQLKHFLWGEPVLPSTLPGGLSQLLSNYERLKNQMHSGAKPPGGTSNGDISGFAGCAVSLSP